MNEGQTGSEIMTKIWGIWVFFSGFFGISSGFLNFSRDFEISSGLLRGIFPNSVKILVDMFVSRG